MDAVELINVTKRYGRIEAVKALSLAIPEGSLFGLIGPNGAGKTTTFGLLSGFVHPTEGEVRVRGRTLTAGRPPVGQILALPQDASLPGGRRVGACLSQLGQLGGMGRAEADAASARALERVGLGEASGRRIRELSHGQRRRVGIASALVGTDEVIVLDEPTAGLDPRTALELRELIRTLHADRTVVLSSHDLAEVESLCTHAGILDRGRLVEVGSMDEVKGTGQRLYVRLTAPVSESAPLIDTLEAVDGVRSVVLEDDATTVMIEIRDASAVDRVTGEALKQLLDAGLVVKGVERGQRLADRFMETTGRDAEGAGSDPASA